MRNKLRIVRGMVENKRVQEEVLHNGKVDTIISEPIGVMLLHERMVESFILARDMFLKPGGSILPSAGHIFFCPFSDEGLYNETEQKVGVPALALTAGTILQPKPLRNGLFRLVRHSPRGSLRPARGRHLPSHNSHRDTMPADHL